MSLLQIHDPAAKPRAIGIDLGTTNSLVAYVTSTGAPVVVRDCDGHALVPSVVHYLPAGSGGERVSVVGHRAQELAVDHPRDTIVSVKRFMGRGAGDPETRRLGPYRFATDQGPIVRFEVAEGRVVTPIEVSAEILRELKERAEDELGAVGGAVITVPAYFDDAQRQATKDAARIAGLEVLRLLNEPTAAALAYGLDQKQNGRFAVFDLGGGTFDVTILDLDDGVFQVRSTGGDSQLGGDDMDRPLAEKVLAALGHEDAAAAPPHAIRYALDAARSIKHALTEAEAVEPELEHEGRAATLRITRADFDAMIRPLLERTGVACRRALRDAQTKPEELDGVILVGGSTRVPAVRAYVRELFGKEPLGSIDPDLVVGLGAALQADMLGGSGPREDVLLLDVLPLSLGLEAMGGVVTRILPRNTAIPCEAAQVFTTYAENQTGFDLHVLQGERELAEDCRSLARFVLKGIPPMPAGLPRLEVRFRVDADGLLHVAAKERTTGIEQDVEVKPSYGLDDAAIEKMLMDAYEHGEDDVAARALREQRVEAERVLHATQKAIDQDPDLLPDAERAAIERAMERVRDAAAKDDHRIVAARIEELDDTTRDFAGRRMDRAIKGALSGRELDSIEQDTASATGIDAHLPPSAREEED
ncbi:MAG: Fe-S protein assembly chaperone HscA [Myxococcota bacterium]|nr:Fe-S protein assembly chaperone HscA [Myxococcota bacterium]